MSSLNLNSNECPSCSKSLSSSRGVRQHHSKVHNEPLPNRVCEICGDEFYDENSVLDHCGDCKKYSNYSNIPDDIDVGIEEWASYSRHKRHYLRNKEYELNRVSDNKKERLKWVKDNFLIGTSCERCGFSDDRAIEFHHTEENKLSKSPTQMARDMRSKELIKNEIERGEMICSNCHMIEHHTERFK